jgi:hypothetical protein
VMGTTRASVADSRVGRHFRETGRRELEARTWWKPLTSVCCERVITGAVHVEQQGEPMFVQVIEGSSNRPDVLHRRLEVWNRELKPGAIGYLGSTGGCTPEGDCIMVVRFESRDAARRNSDRPEQTAWWQVTNRFFVGSVRFHESEDVRVITHGALEHAHRVQAMDGYVTDLHRAHATESDADAVLAAQRPDLLGSVTAYFDDGEFTELAYFATEEVARAGGQRVMSDEAAEAFAEWSEVMLVERYLDLTDPWLIPA